MDNYILKYINNILFIAYNDYAFEIYEKPKLDFLFDTIRYDSIKNEAFYILDGKINNFTEFHIKQCQEYCKNFIDNHDFFVYIYNKNNIYTRKMLKSEAIKLNLSYTFIKPIFPLSKWKDDHWEEVKIIIKDDGSVIHNPVNYCDQCVYFITENEKNQYPNIDKYNDVYHKYNVELKDWFVPENELDIRNKYLEYRLHKIYDIKRWKNVFNKYIPEYERQYWNIEQNEALKYKNDKNSPTPYIDGILSTYKKYNKDEYISKILENISDTKLFDLGKIHGEMQNYIYELKQIENINELENFEEKINNLRK